MDHEEVDSLEKFLDTAWRELLFKVLQSDNEKEFNNRQIRKWGKYREVEPRYTTPDFHQENGKVEREIRTLRAALERTPGPIGVKLREMVDRYNEMTHRGVGMAPNEAVKGENHDSVSNWENKGKKEFITRILIRFNIGDTVVIRNEAKLNKMDYEFKKV